MSEPMEAIERAVATVTDPGDDDQLVAAVRAVSPALVDDVIFGVASSVAGSAADGVLLGVGVAASPGTGMGRVAADAAAALDMWDAGGEVVLVVDETTPADEPAMRVAAAIVTRRGGITSHAAIVARQWGVPAVCGIGALEVADGAQLLVDGGTGEVRALDASDTSDGPAAAEHHGPLQDLPAALATLLGWADRLASPKIRVLANADLAADAQLALDFGAAGIGLCRTEHQFLGARAELVDAVIAGDPSAAAEMIDLQRADIGAVLAVMGDRPVTIRLLDAPLHEFAAGHAEHNPMLGLRGVRLAVLRPQVIQAQAEAIAHAAADVLAATGVAPSVSVMVPMVALTSEMELARSLIGDAVFRVGVERGVTLAIPVGTMIETPRAALAASGLGGVSDFFSFGTNDLTQLTWGFSRDDLDAELIGVYRDRGLIARSPFETLDATGVVRLMALAAETGRAANASLGLGMCGEHGGDPASIAIAVQLGLDSVSVSPYRLPAARLAAAHAVIGPEPATGGA
ncbi:MAG: putative PEP-binding protein [Acidimicrobiales bacterium]